MLLFISACTIDANTEYTLYRTGIDLSANMHNETLRIHVATFDANQEDKYNLANCEFAQELFSAKQPHFFSGIFGNDKQPYHDNIKLKYWCEKGRFKQ